ncbi:sensor histidine kinase [Anaerocolumna sp.]|uniref:sensor histidine kinase n=1 Tax=Anaerocolumna sp. TaxID=2041569 RepID=UPI0028A90BED|nr:HAMP domain-containing sensor histidine kinase [Anaerocolumna sp.]
MNIVHLLIGVIAALVFIVCLLIAKIFYEKKKLDDIVSVLEDIEQGNLNRRVLTFDNDMTSNICYKINSIVSNCKEQLMQNTNIEQANRQIMTSLSHDVKTPLTSLIGYLDAIQSGVVLGEEKESYVGIAWRKAYDLKEYVDTLFEWFKLNSNERQFDFKLVDINELTRNIVIEWIPQFEKSGIAYEISIDDEELYLSLDISAYTRIISNLIHNAILHSGGTVIEIRIVKDKNEAIISIIDNGKGIPTSSLPYIFDRLYKYDEARNTKGSGLGLSIVQELVKAHKGKIAVESVPLINTAFHVYLPFND